MTRRAWNILVSVYSLLTNEICLNLWKLTALSLSSLFHAFTGKETASTNAAWIALVKYILQTLFSKNRIEDDRGNVTVIADEKVLKAGNPPLIYTSLPMPSSFPEVMGNQSWPIYLPIYQFAYLSSCNDYSRVPALVLAAGKKNMANMSPNALVTNGELLQGFDKGSARVSAVYRWVGPAYNSSPIAWLAYDSITKTSSNQLAHRIPSFSSIEIAFEHSILLKLR